MKAAGLQPGFGYIVGKAETVKSAGQPDRPGR
jgi:hypothetical protein